MLPLAGLQMHQQCEHKTLSVTGSLMTPEGNACLQRRSPSSFQVHKLRRGAWQPVQLRITPVAVERLDVASSGQRLWLLCKGIVHIIRVP